VAGRAGTPAARKVPAAAACSGEGRLGGAEKRAGELWVGRRRVEEALGTRDRPGNWSSPRLPKGAGGRLGAAGRTGVCRGQGPWLLLRQRADPQVTSGRAEDASGTRAQATADGLQGNPGDRKAARRSRRPWHARGVGKGRAVLGRLEGTSEGAPAGPDAEGSAGARRRGARACTARDVTTWRDVGPALRTVSA
jgi:hypothetical protein